MIIKEQEIVEKLRQAKDKKLRREYKKALNNLHRDCRIAYDGLLLDAKDKLKQSRTEDYDELYTIGVISDEMRSMYYENELLALPHGVSEFL